MAYLPTVRSCYETGHLAIRITAFGAVLMLSLPVLFITE